MERAELKLGATQRGGRSGAAPLQKEPARCRRYKVSGLRRGGHSMLCPYQEKEGRAKARPYKAREKTEPGRARAKNKKPRPKVGAHFSTLVGYDKNNHLSREIVN